MRSPATHEGACGGQGAATMQSRVTTRAAGAGLLREAVVDSGRAYFVTNTSRHHHFFNTHTHELADIHGDAISVGRLPEAPEGTRVEDVEVVVRVTPARV